MKRLTLLLAGMTLASSSLAQQQPATPGAQQAQSQSPGRVHSTLQVAAPGDPQPAISPPETPETQPPVSRPAEARERFKTGAIPRSCRDLRAEIERKIRDNGVSRFTLRVELAAQAQHDAADRAEPQGAEIVGRCDTGRYRVVYRKGNDS